MSRADYAHWNEEADYVWWQEEGRHDEAEFDPQNDDEGYSSRWDEEFGEVEHEDEDACVADGNFSLPSATGVWVCDGCDHAYPEWGSTPPWERDVVSHAPSERSSGQ